MTNKVSKNCFDLINISEGCKLIAYKCPAGIWTIGIGHTIGVYEGMKITIEKAIELFFADIHGYELQLNDLLSKFNIVLNQNQYDACISFIFNLGIGNFKNSTLFSQMKINPTNPGIEASWKKWNKGNYKDGVDNDGDGLIDEAGELAPLPGLIIRRANEIKLYFS